MRNIESTMTTTYQSEKYKIFKNLEKLSDMNRTINDTENKMRLEPGNPPIKQKTRLIQYH